MGLAANGLLFRATPEASPGGWISATQASACLYIDILVLLGSFLCAVCVITLSYVSLQCWLLDEWVSSTPQRPHTLWGTVLLFPGIDRKVRESDGSRTPALSQDRLTVQTQNFPATDGLSAYRKEVQSWGLPVLAPLLCWTHG